MISLPRGSLVHPTADVSIYTCQKHIVLSMMDLCYDLKSGSVICSDFLSQIRFAIE